MFPVHRVADAMVTNCKLLIVLWSGNDNELCQLQVHICSFIHHCSFVRNKDKVADMGLTCPDLVVKVAQKLTIVMAFTTFIQI
jgi:hypothetical protein